MTKNHNQQLVEEAAQWIVQLSADDEVTRRNAEVQFKQWKKNSQQHQKIANDIERCLGSIQKLSHNHHKKLPNRHSKLGWDQERFIKIFELVQHLQSPYALWVLVHYIYQIHR